jgi:Tfp pilus assembly protein PilF
MQPGADVEPEPGADAEMQPGADAEMQPSADAEMEPGADAEMEPGADVEMEPSADVEMQPSADVEMQSEMEDDLFHAEDYQPDETDALAYEDGLEAEAPSALPALRDPNQLMNAAVHSPVEQRSFPVFGSIVVVATIASAGAMLLMHLRAPKTVKQAHSAHLAPPLEKLRQRWSGGFAGLSGDALQSLKQGEVELQRDTPSGYEEAEKAFQKAFLQEGGSDRAIAGYLQAVAWGRGAALDDPAIEELTKSAEAAEAQWGRSPRLLIAHASLLLLRPDAPRNPERARSLAEEAVATAGGRDKALAHLVLSSAFLSSSAELAIQNSELALKLDPALRRAYFQRAMARESLGDYHSAITDLQKRLSLDVDQWEAKAALSRIFQEVGEPLLALKLYDAAGPAEVDLRAAIARAAIQYQAQHKPQAAAQALNEWVTEHKGVSPVQLAEVWVHLAAAERLAGQPDSAASAANEALKIVSNDPAPRLQLFLIALTRGATDEAERYLAAFKRRLGDPGLEKLLEGRLLLAQRRDPEAMRTFAEAAQLDPRRLDALLLAGAAAASAGRRDETLRYLVPAGQMDPTRTAPAPIATRFYVRPEEHLFGAEGRVVRLAKGSTDVTPRLYEALIRYHQADWSGADKLLQQVLDVDVGNALAHALRALIALHKGSIRASLASGERAVASGRGLALAHYAYGSALVRSGNIEAAQAEFRQAEALSPTLLAAQVNLAELDAKKNGTEAARARLVHVLRVDPSYLAAKRALYNLER